MLNFKYRNPYMRSASLQVNLFVTKGNIWVYSERVSETRSVIICLLRYRTHLDENIIA